MIVTVKHLDMLRRLEQKAKEGSALSRVVDQLTEEDSDLLLHLRLAGLVTEEEDDFTLTSSGLLILESLDMAEREGGLNLSELHESFRLIGSEIISLLMVCEKAQGRTDFDPELNHALEKRGLARNGRLLPWGQAILEAYRRAEIELAVTPALAKTLGEIPPGPARKSFLEGVPANHIFELEAQRLLVFSLPEGQFYSLTGVGNQIRAALKAGLVPEVLLNIAVLKSILAGEKTETLERLGAIDAEGRITYPGRHLLAAAKLFFEPIVVNPSLDLSGWNLTVLQAVKEAPLKTMEGVEEFLAAKEISDPFRIKQSLYRLEGFRLIRTTEEGTYALTEWGEKLLGLEDLSPVQAQAVMALTVTRTENLSLDDTWVLKAEGQGILGNGYPGNKGALLAEIASAIERLPVITREEMLVLRRLPLWRGISEAEVLEMFPEKEHPHVLHALRKLLASGLVDLWPGNLYTLTAAGERIKQGLSGVPEGINFPVTPHTWRLLLALKEIGRFSEKGRKIRVRKEDYALLEKKAGLGMEIFGKTLEAARLCRFVSGLDVLETGVLLLEGLELLKGLKTDWEKIRVW